MEYLGAWGTLIDEKNLKSKISCQTPFGLYFHVVLLLIYKKITVNNSGSQLPLNTYATM
jgi:hypothetical protein